MRGGMGERTRPGEVNAHTHIYSGLAPLGMPAPPRVPSDFRDILGLVWWKLDRALDEASLRASARYYAAHALLHGTTTLVDHHESPQFIEGSLDVIADACQDLGMRVALCYGVTERNGGADEARRGLAECERFSRSNKRPLVRALVGLHASFTVSDETVAEAGELCSRLGVPLHVHVAEDDCDVQDARERGYAGPMERLLELGALPPGSVLAHGVHQDPEQVRGAGRRGCWWVQNPRSNHANAVGYARSLDAAERVALGTDGFESDMQAELEALRMLAARGEPHLPDSGEPELTEAADLRLGRRLEAGRDLAAALFGPDFGAAPDQIEVEGLPDGGRRVLNVVVAGRTVVEDGRLVSGDLAGIEAQAREAAARLWQRMEAM